MPFGKFVKSIGSNLGSVGGAAIGGFLGGPAGAAVGLGLGSTLDAPSLGSQQRWDEKQLDKLNKNTLEQITLGNKLDIDNQKEMFDYRINQGIDAGMTPYEMYMGPAAGAGGGTTGSGQTLGNAGANFQTQAKVAADQREMQREENQRDRLTSLAQTAMQTDAQRDVAQISHDATIGSSQLNLAGVKERIAFDEKVFQQTTLPESAAAIAKTEAETKKAINEIATSDKDFVLYMKKLSMGPDNMIAEMYQQIHNIDVTNGSDLRKLPMETRQKLLSGAIALKAKLNTELSFLAEGADNALEALWRIVSNPVGLQKQISPSLGNKGSARMSEQMKYGPDMNIR